MSNLPAIGLACTASGLYLVHYGFVVWLQYLLLGTALHAVIEAAIMFGATLLLSCFVVSTVQRLPFGAPLTGSRPRAAAVS